MKTRRSQIKKPIAYETIWGEPERRVVRRQKAADNYCPDKRMNCVFWDRGCQAEMCSMSLKGESVK